jgi:hypothetical protein
MTSYRRRSQKSAQMMMPAMVRIVASIGVPILTAGPPVLLAHYEQVGEFCLGMSAAAA